MKIETKIARAGYGEIDVRGRAILGGEDHNWHPWSMVSIALGHRPLSGKERYALNLVANLVFIGDPRLWPFRAQRLVGVYGDRYLSLAANMAFFSGASIGSPAALHTMVKLQELAEAVGIDGEQAEVDAWLMELLERGERISGYNVVARPSDERRDFMVPELEADGWLTRPWFRLLTRLDDAMRRLKGIEPNVASTTAAIMLEIGYTPEQAEMFCAALAMWSAVANAEESANGEYDELQQLPDDCVNWCGAAPRESPRAHGLD